MKKRHNPTPISSSEESRKKHKKKRNYHLGTDAKTRSQFPPELFDIFKKTLGYMQVPGHTVDMVWLIRSGYIKSFPKNTIPEPKVRIDPVSGSSKKNMGKELGYYTKVSNQPVVLGTIPIDSRLGKVGEQGLPEQYNLDSDQSAILARSLNHIISQIEHGIYELVDEGQDAQYLVFKVNPLYTDSANVIRSVNVPIDGVQHLYRLDLKKIVEIDQLKRRENQKKAYTELESLIPQTRITTIEALKVHAEKNITFGKKNKPLRKLNYQVDIKFNKERDYQNLLIGTNAQGHPLVSDVDGFDFLLPEEYWELIAEKYREFNQQSNFSAADAKRLFNGVICTDALEISFLTNTVDENLFEQFQKQTISLDEATHAFHFLLYLFHPEYKDRPYSKKIGSQEIEELDRLMNLSERGVIKPIILLLLSLLNWNISKGFSHLGALGMHGFEVHNIEKPQPIEGVASVCFSQATQKYQVGLAYGPEDLVQLLKNLHPQQSLKMNANPLQTPDWVELEEALKGSEGIIKIEQDPALKFYCTATLATQTKPKIERSRSWLVEGPSASKSLKNMVRSATVPCERKNNFDFSDEESTLAVSSPEANEDILEVANFPEIDYREMPPLERTIDYKDMPSLERTKASTIIVTSANSKRGCFGWLWSCCKTSSEREEPITSAPAPFSTRYGTSL